MMRVCLCIFLVAGLASSGAAAMYQKQVDSLRVLLKNSPADTQKVKILNTLGSYLSASDYPTAEAYLLQAKALSIELAYEEGTANADFVLGAVNYQTGNFPEALKYFFDALSVVERLGIEERISALYINIGLVYGVQGELENARMYYHKSLEMKEKSGAILGVAGIHNNLGLLDEQEKKYDEALVHFQKSLKLRKSVGDPSFIADSYTTIALFYFNKDQMDSALAIYYRVLKLFESIDFKDRIALAHFNIGSTLVKMGVHGEGIEQLKESSRLFTELGRKQYIKMTFEILSISYELEQNYEEAYKYYQKFTALKDSLFNETKSKEIGKLEAKFEFEKAEEERQRAEEERLAAEAAVEGRRNNLQYSGILIFLVLLTAVMVMLGRLAIPVRFAEGMIFFTFLLFFEFTLVLLDPYIEQYSSGAPAIKLAFNALLAGLIFPLHSFFESKLKKRIVK